MKGQYTTREAAEMLGVNPRTLLSWINSGRVVARKALFGQGWRFSKADVDRIAKWRSGDPSSALDLVKAAKSDPDRVWPVHAHLRPDLKLYGAPFKGSYPYGPEHPYALLGKWKDEAMRSPPWSTLESPEYIEALEQHRSKPAPVATRTPEQEATTAWFEQFEAENNFPDPLD